MATDFYQVLGVRSDASTEDIKKAYRRRARDLHPDANPDDPESEERFKELTLAYDTLRDPERRRRYDLFGPEVAQGAGPSPFGDSFGMGDIFDAFFGESIFGGRRRGAGRARQPGPDAAVDVRIPFETAVFGGEVSIEAEVLVRCERCSGSGAEPGTTPVRCRRCQGRGEIQEVRRTLLGSMMVSTACPTCQGSGEEIDSRCTRCRGEGRHSEVRVVTPQVPAGVQDGTQLRLTGRGHAGPRGGPPGDLYVRLEVTPHPTLERIGNDLVARVRVGIGQASLGARLQIPTLDGDQELIVPPGTQPGRVFTLRHGGVPFLNGRSRGDLKVVVDVDVPTTLSPEEEKLLRRLAELRGEEVADHKGFFERLKSAFS
jgi:molecular chaperone DnaJ